MPERPRSMADQRLALVPYFGASLYHQHGRPLRTAAAAALPLALVILASPHSFAVTRLAFGVCLLLSPRYCSLQSFTF